MSISIRYQPRGFERFTQDVQNILDDGALDLATELQQESPVGVSGDLKGGWDVEIKKFEVVVVNRTPNALERTVGRAPGKFPPYGENTPLGKWARSKGIPAFLIARKIAREGTDRWKEQRNFAGLDREGNPYRGGTIDRARDELARKLKNIRVT